MLHISKDLQRSIVTRIKILSKLKLNVEDVPQDGRITFLLFAKTHRRARVRAAFRLRRRNCYAPARYRRQHTKVKDLGFSVQALEVVERQLQKPNGMVITTGPTAPVRPLRFTHF